MTASMDWNNLNFKATDLVKFIIGLVTVIWTASTINNKIDNIGENQTEMRESQVEFIKEYRISQEALKNQVNAQGIEIKLQGMRIEALENKNTSK